MERPSSRERQWTNPEIVDLLAEIIKAGTVAPEILFRFVQDIGIQPKWEDIPLPQGRSLNQCRQLFDTLRVHIPYSAPPGFPSSPYGSSGPLARPGSPSRKRPLAPDTTGPLLPPQVTGGGRPLQPKPQPQPHAPLHSQHGHQLQALPSPDRARAGIGASAPPYALSPAPHSEASGQQGRKKRGRPTKLEAQRRAEAVARGEIPPGQPRSAKKIMTSPPSGTDALPSAGLSPALGGSIGGGHLSATSSATSPLPSAELGQESPAILERQRLSDLFRERQRELDREHERDPWRASLGGGTGVGLGASAGPSLIPTPNIPHEGNEPPAGVGPGQRMSQPGMPSTGVGASPAGAQGPSSKIYNENGKRNGMSRSITPTLSLLDRTSDEKSRSDSLRPDEIMSKRPLSEPPTNYSQEPIMTLIPSHEHSNESYGSLNPRRPIMQHRPFHWQPLRRMATRQHTTPSRFDDAETSTDYDPYHTSITPNCPLLDSNNARPVRVGAWGNTTFCLGLDTLSNEETTPAYDR
ncbi:hypothetical protein P152DRAFT_475810 [Eremomyces bilateralis CBS 781.70]|uniref:Myb-like domain-containing protein n=1 Tax=Eremomyces bilateralis CBS 781.70 TaxID=1392243 RepID=A0A6G1FWU7_9PEZI|nr:uncharacterized protein P152DRAFT_475810 [Eremomyces bilateralis CBS 781.70]KAF1810244.1 hypothetical protein P152DRAFT_475810 [Eremomyces bilateralis CBS 781.70]